MRAEFVKKGRVFIGAGPCLQSRRGQEDVESTRVRHHTRRLESKGNEGIFRDRETPIVVADLLERIMDGGGGTDDFPWTRAERNDVHLGDDKSVRRWIPAWRRRRCPRDVGRPREHQGTGCGECRREVPRRGGHGRGNLLEAAEEGVSRMRLCLHVQEAPRHVRAHVRKVMLCIREQPYEAQASTQAPVYAFRPPATYARSMGDGGR